MDPQVRQTNPMMMNYPQSSQWNQHQQQPQPQQQQPLPSNQQSYYYQNQNYQQQQFSNNSVPPQSSLSSNEMVTKSQSGDQQQTGSLANQMSNLSLNNSQPPLQQNNDSMKANLQNGQNVSYSNQYSQPNNSASSYTNSQMTSPPTAMAPNSYNYNNNQQSQQQFQRHSIPPPQAPSSSAGVSGNWNQNPIKTTMQQQQQPVVTTSPSSSSTNYQYNNSFDGQHQQQNGSLPIQSNYQQTSQNMYQHPNAYQQQPPPPPMAGQQQSMNSSNNQYGSPYGMPPPPSNRYGSTPSSPTGFGSMGPTSPFNQQTQQAQNKLDPDAMPSVVQVILEDKSKYETNSPVLFTTTIPASVPPLVTTVMENENQIIQDGGCASPLFVRPTIYQVPTSDDIIKTTDIPFGMLIKPFDDQEVERKIYVPISSSEIVRCNRCKAYMNPYNRFIDGGRRFQCSLCHHVTEVSQTYFANLDHTGQRLDRQQRPELCLGSYEFLATEEYCHNGVQNNRRPHLIFACELTETSRPILNILSANLPNIIKNFPRDTGHQESLPPMFGFITYNSKIQIYDIVNNGHAHVICDLTTPFAPLNTFLVDPLVHMDKIENFFKRLPELYSNEEMDMQTILGPVIEASLMSTQVDVNNWINKNIVNKIVNNNNGDQQSNNSIPVGKMFMFHCTLPTYGSDADTPGRLKQKWTNTVDELRKIIGTDKEKTVLSPLTNKYYIELGQKCVTDYATGVELFLFPPLNGFLDIAILGELTRLTGTGSIFKFYNDFSDSFLTDLKYSLNSSFAFESVLKIRTSTGIRPNDYYGYFYSRSPSDVECAAINTTTNIAIEFKYDDKLTEDEHVVIQSAILYTSLSGQRRIRIHNIALASCTQIGDLYRNACCDSIVNILARIAVNQLRNGDKTIQQTKESIVNRVINILTAYRKHCAQPGTSLGQLILPEALKILPMYICGLLKCDAIDGGPEISPDDKAYAQLKLLGSFLSTSQLFLYPKLYRIEYENEQTDSENNTLKYTQIRCSAYKLTSASLAYVLENGFYVMFYITSNGCNNVKFLNGLFGPNVDSATKIKMDSPLPTLLTNESQFVHQLLKKMEMERKCSYKIFIIRQGIDKTESVFRSFLYEDQKMLTRQAGDSKLEGLSYVDLLCHLHKEIRAQLN